MRIVQRRPLLRLFAALVLSLVPALAAWHAGSALLGICIVVVGGITVFALLTVAPDAIALQRGHWWRWWRSSDDEGPFWPGTRIPRGPRSPRPPSPPPRA